MKELILAHNSDIDLIKWDTCINAAPNSRLYAYSWYLDIVFPDWQGLIYGDYEYVMPIPLSKRWGIKYMLQPPYAQQWGVFPPPDKETINLFTNRLLNEARYIQISLNSQNPPPEVFKVITKHNYLLPMEANYENLRSAYNKHTKRYTNKAKKSVAVNHHITIDQYLQLKKSASGKFIDEKLLAILKLILLKVSERGMLELIGAYNEHNEICAGAAFIHNQQRITYINGTSTDIGKELRAMYAIFDFFLKEHAENKKTLDFEGSSIPGVARFFKGFGAQLEYYYFIKQNRLPFIIKGLVK